MKYIITESQYKLLIEQTNDVDWLFNWFKKVPENKLTKAFTAKDDKGLNKTLSRNEILKLLSDKSKVMFINDPKEVQRLGLDLASFRYAKPSNSKPGDEKYIGKILINGNWKNIIKNDPMYKDVKGLSTIKHHEGIHLLQYQKRNNNKKEEFKGDWSSWSKIVSGFCKFSTTKFCKERTPWGFGYYERPEEIYAHLFTMREILGMEPLDVVVDANVTIKNTTATINVSVNRNGKTIKLPTKTMSTESSTFITLYCCNQSFKQTFMYLHNTLAKNYDQNKSDFSNIA